MTQNPFAQPGRMQQPQFGNFGAPADYEPVVRRTSVLAIFSLILALLCFIPGSGALAIIFGGAAILFISSSKGRLAGMGLAIAGVLIGIIVSFIWIAIIYGVSSGARAVLEPAGTTMAAVDKGDYTAARAQFSPTLNAAVTDADIDAFAASYRQTLGNYQSVPDSILSWFGAFFGPVGQTMQGFRGQNEIPVPATFDKGVAVVLVAMPTSGPASPSPGLPPMENLGIILPDSTQLWLKPRASGNAPVAPPAAPRIESPADPAPAAPDGSTTPASPPGRG